MGKLWLKNVWGNYDEKGEETPPPFHIESFVVVFLAYLRIDGWVAYDMQATLCERCVY
jgi:hypothetical protein